MSSLLLHTCCVHCAAYCIEHWRGKGCQVTLYWYNPNIHPVQEYLARLDSMRKLAEQFGVPIVVSDKYDAPRYFRATQTVVLPSLTETSQSEGDKPRCAICFDLRLGRTADEAMTGGFDAFTTTLLISPQQRREFVVEAGRRAQKRTGVLFMDEDLRKRYSDSRRITKRMDVYRQQYCGCVFSEWERYVGEDRQGNSTH